jgi:hypothetical protein
METVELDIEKYDLVDLLKLFKLDYDFDREDLKRAKKIALMTHPDKSGLDKKYFIFFSAAYKAVYEIYQFRHKIKHQSSEYTQLENNRPEHKIFLKYIEDKKNFSKWFNKMFDETVIKDEYSNSGYGDWMTSNDDIDNHTTTMENMANTFEKKKSELRAIIPHNDFREITASNLCDLTNSRPDSYSSDMFSKLQFEDLKKAHTETVVPVSMEDYKNKKKYRNVNELHQERTIQSKQAFPSYEQHQTFLEEQQRSQSVNDTERAYKLIKQDIEIEKVNKRWWSGVLQLMSDK